MPLPWALRALTEGTLTTPYPRRSDEYFDAFAACVETLRDAPSTSEAPNQDQLDAICPTGALHAPHSAGSVITVDHGACILCGRCVRAYPQTFGWRAGADVAELTKDALVVPTGDGTEAEVTRVRQALAARVQVLRRSVHIRHIDVGSDGSDEWEINALWNPVYDANRLGIYLTASPRHADILLVTGIGNAGMRAPLARTREAMPDPVVVVAVGADAVSGGLYRHGYASHGGVRDMVDVDVWVPGSPASPFSILHGLLLALGRIPTKTVTRQGSAP